MTVQHPEGWEGILSSDELITWQGQPDASLFAFRKADIFLIPFSLLWGGFAFIWNAIVWLSNTAFFLKLWGLPFLIIGIYLIVGRFIHSAARRKRTFYTLTNKRAFIGTRFGSRKLRETDLARVAEIHLTPGHLGEITFGAPSGSMKRSDGWGAWSGTRTDFTFERLQNPEEVYQKVQASRQGGT